MADVTDVNDSPVPSTTETEDLPGSADIASKAAMFLAQSTAGSDHTTARALRRLGFDEGVVTTLVAGLRRGGELDTLLLEVFGRLTTTAPAPPRVAGSLLVVVGAGPHARRLAAAVAGDLGTDSAAVPYASLTAGAHHIVSPALLVRSAEEAAELGPGWRRSQPAVVVVDAPVTDGHRAWARHVIASLRPTAVWGVVPATCKPEDINAWAGALGGVDCLVLENLGATSSPVAVLASGIPVVRLDGQPTTAARWTAIVVDRINSSTGPGAAHDVTPGVSTTGAVPRSIGPPVACSGAGAQTMVGVTARLAAILGPAFVAGPGDTVTNGNGRHPSSFSSTRATPAPPDIADKAAWFLAQQNLPPTDATIDALLRSGLDETMTASVAQGLRHGGDLDVLLLKAFGHLPPAPPLARGAGNLLVVTGTGARARRLAAVLSGEIGGDPAEVPFASLDADAHSLMTVKFLVRSAEDAAELAPGWRRSEPAVVVVDAPVTGRHRSWATSVIASLHPTAVWGVVDATCKSEDIAAWAGALGGLDALALENVDVTVSPAAALTLGIPVARLDGHPATAARWTATIVDRVQPFH
jgi:hypothetical protein